MPLFLNFFPKFPESFSCLACVYSQYTTCTRCGVFSGFYTRYTFSSRGNVILIYLCVYFLVYT